MSMRKHMLLVEMYRLQTILLESRIDFLKKTFIPKMEQLFVAGLLDIAFDLPNGNNWMSEPEAKGSRPIQLAARLFDYVINCDPDPAKKNVQWLLTLITRKTNPMPTEDLAYAFESLTKFAEMRKAKLIPADKQDINKFKSLSDLNATMRGEQDQQVATVASEEQAMRKESNIIYDGSDFSIISPMTQKAACYFGRNAAWCTAWGDHLKLGLTQQGMYPTRTNMFDHYNKSGPIYVITDKATGTQWQFSFVDEQYMDVNDRPINLAAFFKQYPKIEKIFAKMDGDPVAELQGGEHTRMGYPVYKTGNSYTVKSQPGPMGKALLRFNVDDDKILINMQGTWLAEFINHGKSNRSLTMPVKPEDIAAFMTGMRITGDPLGEETFGLFYRQNKWGNLRELAMPIYKFGDSDLFGHPITWKQVETKEWRHLIMTGTNDVEYLQADLDKNDGAFTVNDFYKTAYDAEMQRKKGKKYLRPASYILPIVSFGITEFLLKENVQSWGKDSQVKGFELAKEDADKLIEAKPYLGDIATAYHVHGPSDAVKKMVVDWCEASDISCGDGYHGGAENPWYENDLIIEQFKDISDLVKEMGDDTTQSIFKNMSGDGDFEVYDATAESDQVRDMLKSLSPEDLKRVGEYLQENHPDDAEDIDDYDPTNLSDVFELFKATDDDEIQSAANDASRTANQYGAEEEMHDAFWKRIKESRYINFFGKEPAHDTPCAFVIPIKDIVEFIEQHNNDEEDAGSDINGSGWLDQFEAKIEVSEPYYGWQGYDEKVADERFAEAIEEFLVPSGTITG